MHTYTDFHIQTLADALNELSKSKATKKLGRKAQLSYNVLVNFVGAYIIDDRSPGRVIDDALTDLREKISDLQSRVEDLECPGRAK